MAWAFVRDGTLQRLPLEQTSGSEARVELPTTMQSTTVLLNRCEPLVYPQVPTMVAAGTTVPVRAEVLNLNASAIEGTLKWDVPNGWGATAQTFGPVASGEAVEVVGEVTIGANATRRPYGVFCVAETEDGAGRRYAEMAVVPSPYLEWTWEADGALRTSLLNLEDSPIEASVEVLLPPECGTVAAPETQGVRIPADGRADAVFRLRGTDTIQEAAGMRIVVGRDGDRREAPVRLFPAICNGSFEIDRAGDGKPEYWTTYDYSGKVQMVDESVPAALLPSLVAENYRVRGQVDGHVGDLDAHSTGLGIGGHLDGGNVPGISVGDGQPRHYDARAVVDCDRGVIRTGAGGFEACLNRVVQDLDVAARAQLHGRHAEVGEPVPLDEHIVDGPRLGDAALAPEGI